MIKINFNEIKIKMTKFKEKIHTTDPIQVAGAQGDQSLYFVMQQTNLASKEKNKKMKY